MADDFTDRLRQLIREVVREELATVTRPADPDRYLSTAEAAERASVAAGTIRRWVREGRIPGHRAGRVLRVRERDLEALLAPGRRARPAAQASPEELARRDFGVAR